MSVSSSLRRLIPQGLKNFVRQQTPEWRLSRQLSPSLPEVVCVDVGASYYPHAKWLQFLNSPRTRWLAVEPNEKNLTYVKSWVWPATISTCTTGLSSSGGRQTLYVTNVDSGSSLLPPEIPDSMRSRVTNLDYFFPVREVAIETLTLVQATGTMPTQAPMFVKLDTQGTELSILQGAQELFDQQRILGIEIESTLLANPLMKGAGKFWQVCECLEFRGFELLRVKPIHAIPRSGRVKKQKHAYLNECDAVFALRQDIVLTQPVDRRASLLAFYITNLLYEDAASMLETDKPLADYLAGQGCGVAKLLGQLKAAI